MYKSETGEPIQTTFNEPLVDTMTMKETNEVEQINKTELNKHKVSICSAEVSHFTERKTPTECVETISEAVDTQNLVSEIRNETPRPASPTPEDVSSPLIEKQTFEEMCSKEENNNEIQISYKDNMEFSGIQTQELSFIEALTTAPERPYSPFPNTTQAPAVCTFTQNNTQIEERVKEPEVKVMEDLKQSQTEVVTVSQSSAVETSESEQIAIRKTYCSIPPIKPYVPINKPSGETFSMPEETTPYFPPDISMTIEPRPPRDGAVSPFVSALTVAPARPYTPLGAQPIERGSLVEALTVAPARPFTPISSECTNHFTESISQSISQTQSQSLTASSTSFECIKPVATQPCQTFMQTSQAPIQTACQLQSSVQTSAFKPVMKSVQTFPPPPPCEFAGEPKSSFPPVTEELKAQYMNNSLQCQTMTSESHQVSQSCEQFTSRKSFENKQSVFEQSLKDEKLTSYAKSQSSGLHMPSHLPGYQQNLEHLPSQMGITPEVVSDPPILQAPITPVMATESNNPTIKKVQRPAEPEPLPPVVTFPPPQIIPEVEKISDFHQDVPITMTFQPVSENMSLRVTPTIRSRPHTPSQINKPAPLIPYYQMNLISVEHNAAETNLYEPSSPDVSRSPTPKLRTRSPAPGPPANPLKAPRVKEAPQQHQPLLCQATSNLRKEHEMIQAKFESGVETYNASGAKNWSSIQQYETEHKQSKIGFHSQENVQTMMSESSMMNQQSMQQACETQMTYESGMNSVQRTKKMFEEFERKQSTKTVEVQRRGSNSSTKILSNYPPLQQPQSNQYQLNNIQSEAVKPSIIPSQVQTFPPTDFSTQMNMAPKPSSISGQPPFTNSGANNKTSGPVCDPTPSAGAVSGAGAGAGGRGKAFGVSSAPKRGRGILNKAAVPGTRVPLCGHCNGQIRGPFITALGRIWCPDHFVCVNNTCRRQLQDIGFVEENGQLYCEYCFEQFIAPACDKCHGKIKGDCLNAIGKHFHPECFSCAYCGKLFGNNPFFLEEGLPYCEADWNELFTTKCFACGFPVEAGDRWVEALNNNYHSQCFNCTMCKKNLEGQSFYAKGGRPFCKNHAR